jgi:sucrose phosphorylase
VRRLCDLIRLRNSHPAFAGEFELLEGPAHALRLRWTAGRARAELAVDFVQRTFAVTT